MPGYFVNKHYERILGIFNTPHSYPIPEWIHFEQGKLIEACSQQTSGETALLDSMRIHMGYFQQIPFQTPPSRQLENYSVTRLLMNFSRPFELEEVFIQKIDGLLMG